jgi:cytochrome c
MRPYLAMLTVLLLGAAMIADAAAEALAKKSKCLGCHSVDKKKDAPSFKSDAAKYKGDASAEQKLYTHLTTHPMVEVDGKKEPHDSLQTKSDGEVKNVVGWILSR